MEASSIPSPAELYEQFYGPTIFQPLANVVVDQASPPAGGRVLDMACGTGVVTRAVAERLGPAGHIMAVDINPAMLEMAKRQTVPQGASVDWVHADAAAVALPKAHFDVAYCQQGLQFVSDRVAAMEQVRGALKPGGQAVIATWRSIDHQPFMAAFAEVEAVHLRHVGVSYEDLIAPFALGSPDALRDLLGQSGFAQVRIADHVVLVRFPNPETVARNLETAYGAVIPEFVADPAAFAAYVAAVERDTRTIVEQYTVADYVVFEMPTLLAVAS
jgi:SAM-dependent methyltransferase